MNERIKELAEQASHQSPDGYPITIPYTKDFVKKFAQLIVAECLSVIEEMNPHDPERDIDDIFVEVEEHFGVKE